jgi:hypothetical protein
VFKLKNLYLFVQFCVNVCFILFRPPWNAGMSVEQLDANEKQSFLLWRRSLARLDLCHDSLYQVSIINVKNNILAIHIQLTFYYEMP